MLRPHSAARRRDRCSRSARRTATGRPRTADRSPTDRPSSDRRQHRASTRRSTPRRFAGEFAASAPALSSRPMAPTRLHVHADSANAGPARRDGTWTRRSRWQAHPPGPQQQGRGRPRATRSCSDTTELRMPATDGQSLRREGAGSSRAQTRMGRWRPPAEKSTALITRDGPCAPEGRTGRLWRVQAARSGARRSPPPRPRATAPRTPNTPIARSNSARSTGACATCRKRLEALRVVDAAPSDPRRGVLRRDGRGRERRQRRQRSATASSARTRPTPSSAGSASTRRWRGRC